MSCNTIHGKVDDLVLAIKFTLNKDYPIYTNLANFSKLIKDYFDNTDWCGFYLVEKDNNLYLGPFQGETATPFIEMGKGVCGTAAATKKSQLVPNVHEFEGHIACSSLSNSEVVVPIVHNNIVFGVIDLDSNLFNNYTEKDVEILEKVANIISLLF